MQVDHPFTLLCEKLRSATPSQTLENLYQVYYAINTMDVASLCAAKQVLETLRDLGVTNDTAVRRVVDRLAQSIAARGQALRAGIECVTSPDFVLLRTHAVASFK